VLKATDSRVIDDADALYRRAGNLVRAGHYDAAERLLDEVLEAGGVSEQADAYWLLAIGLRQQGRLAEALDATRRMRAIAPHPSLPIAGSAPSVAALEAQLLAELGRPRAAAALFDSIARGREQLDSKATAARRATWNLAHSADARAAAGDTAALHRLIDSVRSLGEASGYGRDRRLHHHVRGLMLVARGDDEAAVAEFRRAVFTWSYGYTRTNYELARALLRLGRAAEAVAALQPALRGGLEGSNLYVTRTELHELLAQAWDAAGGLDSAAAHYRIVARAWHRADPLLQVRRARAEAR
jgi:tetratricopeptide (TPR) repeat protein